MQRADAKTCCLLTGMAAAEITSRNQHPSARQQEVIPPSRKHKSHTSLQLRVSSEFQ